MTAPESTPSSSFPPHLKRWKLRMTPRRWLFAIASLIALGVVYVSREVMLPIVLGMVVAFVFMPAVRRLERRGFKRGAAILSIYAVVIGILYAFGALAAPRIRAETRLILKELPRNAKIIEEEYLPKLQARFNAATGSTATSDGAPATASSAASAGERARTPPALQIVQRDEDDGFDVVVGNGFDVVPHDDGWRIEPIDAAPKHGLSKAAGWLEHNSMQLFRSSVTFVGSVAHGVFVFFMTLMIGAYLMLTNEEVFGFFRGLLLPPARPDFDRLIDRTERGLSGVVRGQLLICVVNGVLTAVGYKLIGLKYWPVMALIAAVMSLIPIFGAILSSVPAVAVGLTQSPATALMVAGWIVVIHQLEANVLNPKIIGSSAHLHPVLIVFSLLVGEHFFQATGALLAVPVLSILQSLFLHFREIAERDDLTLHRLESMPPPPPTVPPRGV